MKALPAICSDVDGVLLRGRKITGRSDITLKYILQPLSKLFPQYFDKSFSKNQLPFLCLTNGGGQLESDKAFQMNKYMNLGQDNFYSLKGKNIILNFTPLRPYFATEYKYKNVMLIGSGKIKKIADDCGLQRYITYEEFAALYPERFLNYPRKRPERSEVLQSIMKRFQLKNQSELKSPLQMNAIFVLHDPIYWEECFQIILEYCSTENGILRNNMPTLPMKKQKHIPIFTVNNDITYAEEFTLPRFAYGPFTHCLRAIFQKYYGYQPQIIEYGKPTLNTSKYAENYVKTTNPFPITNFYIVGDNPKSDIRGGNLAGWKTILVKSGVFEDVIQEGDKPQYIVDDFYEAAKLIFKLENLPWTI